MTTLLIDITPHADGKRCGECWSCASQRGFREWATWYSSDGYGEYRRGPNCLAAERRVKELRVAVLREVVQRIRDGGGWFRDVINHMIAEAEK